MPRWGKVSGNSYPVPLEVAGVNLQSLILGGAKHALVAPSREQYIGNIDHT